MESQYPYPQTPYPQTPDHPVFSTGGYLAAKVDKLSSHKIRGPGGLGVRTTYPIQNEFELNPAGANLPSQSRTPSPAMQDFNRQARLAARRRDAELQRMQRHMADPSGFAAPMPSALRQELEQQHWEEQQARRAERRQMELQERAGYADDQYDDYEEDDWEGEEEYPEYEEQYPREHQGQYYNDPRRQPGYRYQHRPTHPRPNNYEGRWVCCKCGYGWGTLDTHCANDRCSSYSSGGHRRCPDCGTV